jgi:hypothetical protein
MALRPETGDHTGITYLDPVNFIPELYSKKVLRNFYENTIFADITNTDYEGEIKNQGAKVIIRKTPELTVNPYTIGEELTYEVPVKDSTELNIDQAFYTAFQIEDVEKVQSDVEMVNMFAKDASERVKIEVSREVLAYMSLLPAATNQGATAGAISADIDLGLILGVGASVTIDETNAIKKIVQLNQVLDEANIPSEGRWLTLPAWYCALLKLGDLRRVDVTGDSTGVIRNGLIGTVDNTMIYKTNGLLTATDGDTDLSTYVMCGTKEAASFAAQVTKTDTLKIQNAFGEYWRSLFVYGRAIVQDTAFASMVCKPGAAA